MADLVDLADAGVFVADRPAVEAAGHPTQGSGRLAMLARQAERAVTQGGAGRRISLAVKRCMDIVIASAALVFFAPFFALIVFLIKRESPGPAIFVQERWGRGMRKIRVYKFRSMHLDRCDLSGVSQTVPDDPRVTRVGRILRRSNLDEVPQLINVLKGDLSLVGPRCHPVDMRAAGRPYEELVPQYHVRHLMRPGITGLAQVNGYRGPTTDAGKAVMRVACDLKYISDFNIFADVKILLATVLRELRGGTGF